MIILLLNIPYALFLVLFWFQIIPHRYDYLKKQQGLSLTLDGWTTSLVQGVLGIKVSYVDENFCYNVETLSIEQLDGRHTAPMIEILVRQVLDKCGLMGKVIN